MLKVLCWRVRGVSSYQQQGTRIGIVAASQPQRCWQPVSRSWLWSLPSGQQLLLLLEKMFSTAEQLGPVTAMPKLEIIVWNSEGLFLGIRHQKFLFWNTTEMFNHKQMALKTLSGDLFEIIRVRKNEAYLVFSLAVHSSKSWGEGLLSWITNSFAINVLMNKRCLKNTWSYMFFQW